MQLLLRDSGTVVLEATEQTSTLDLKAAYALKVYGVEAVNSLVSSLVTMLCKQHGYACMHGPHAAVRPLGDSLWQGD